MGDDGRPFAAEVRGLRSHIDGLLRRLVDPAFAALHRRSPSLRHTSPHASAVMLAACTRDSEYVHAFLPHARCCPACRKLFAYFGFEVEG